MDSAASDLSCRLTELIKENGGLREEERCSQWAEQGSARSNFGADLILREESGFELWLGSLDDALNLDALQTQHIDAILNCASEESDRECEPFRVPIRGGRRRSHARGASSSQLDKDIFTCASAVDGGCTTLAADQIKSAASFDDEWYAHTLGYSTAYCSIDASDSDGYPMDQHFPEISSFLQVCRQERRRVLVHCIMGVNRSSAAMVAFLCEGLGYDLEEAIISVSKQRGFILSNTSFLDQLVAKYGGNRVGTCSTKQDASEETHGRRDSDREVIDSDNKKPTIITDGDAMGNDSTCSTPLPSCLRNSCTPNTMKIVTFDE